MFLSLETARKMWKESVNVSPSNLAIEYFLLENYTREELEAKELPKTFEEIGNSIKSYYIDNCSRIINNLSRGDKFKNKNVFPTKELANASLALAQLLQLRDVYNGDWKVDLNNRPNETVYCIRNKYNNIYLSGARIFNYILSFKTENLRDQFVENFKDLITIALPLL